MYFSVVEGVGVDGDAIGVAQDGVFHHIDPGVNGRNGAFVPNGIVEVFSNIPNLLHDVLGSIGDFVSDGQPVHVASAIFLHGFDESVHVFVDLVKIGGTLSSFSFGHRGGLGPTREAELAIVPSDVFWINE